jgi:hypothetical protein
VGHGEFSICLLYCHHRSSNGACYGVKGMAYNRILR